MKHARLYLFGTAALTLGHWVPAHAADATPGPGLQEISDEELGDMRGRYTVGDNAVAWFGVTMISTWRNDAGQILQGTMALSMDFTHANQPTVRFQPSVSITAADAPRPANTDKPTQRSVDAGGLANVGGLVQSVQVAGDENLASNVTRLTVHDGDAPPAGSLASGSATEHGVARAYGDGTSAISRFDGTSAEVLLTVDGQGAVAQWIHDGSIGQSVQLTADNQWVSNRMEIDLVRQTVSTNAQLAQNVAQSIALARGIAIR